MEQPQEQVAPEQAAQQDQLLTANEQYAIRHGFPRFYTPEDVDAALRFQR